MADRDRPLLLIDVDGVLNPLARRLRSGFTNYVLLGYDVQLAPHHGRWLTGLADLYDLVWATTWEHDADKLIAPIVGLPAGLPVIEFRSEPLDHTWKLPDVADFVGDRAFAWIDDDLYVDAFEWAERRSAPTLLVRTDRTVGLTADHIDELRAFGEGIAAV